jgi:hypothetical protein
LETKGFSVIEVKDIYDNIHARCPRCGGAWINDLSGIECEKSQCIYAIRSVVNKSKHIFTLTISSDNKKYFIEWWLNGCIISFKENDKWIGEDLQLNCPLPYNITFERIKKLIIFT